VFFERDGKIYRTIEELRFEQPASKITNHLWCIERQHSNATARIMMHDDSMLIDCSSPVVMTLVTDIKQSYDNRVWGREYEVTAEQGCMLVNFSKHNDNRDDNSTHHDEYKCCLAVCALPLDYAPIKQWEEHFYSQDNSRGSTPDKRWVFIAARLKAARIAFGFGMTKQEAIKQARKTLANATRIMQSEESRVSRLVRQSMLENKEAEASRKCCVHGLDALGVKENGLYAGLPWFFQFWTRDEAVAAGGLIAQGKTEEAKKTLAWLVDNT
jgi:hypothetical protein